MARRGARIGWVVWLAVGCADSEPKPVVWNNDSDGDAAADEGGGGAGGSGASGPSGSGGADAGTGGDDGGQLECTHWLPSVHACVQGDGITVAGMDETHVELTGTVERAEAHLFGCIAGAAARAFGNLGKQEQTYVVRDGEKALELAMATGSERPLLTIGQRVRVTVDDLPSGSMLRDSVVLSVRDDADGRILYWFARTELGPDGLALPAGFTASNAGPECRFDGECGVQYRRGLALLEGNQEVAIAIGELASIGGLAALLIDDTEQVQGAGGPCFDSAPHHRVSVALFDRDLITKCDWREDERCTDDDCRDVRASLIGYGDQAPRFIACVEDNSCGDGDLVTCAINDRTERLAEFTTTCVPPGWTEAYGACDPDSDAGSP